ncbi:MAG: biopolymer transporter ExbD [Verrucomicrobiota bacterium]
MAKKSELFEGPSVKADLSPMIDLVFLLLIFFLVTANMITFPKDPRVTVPIASDSKVPELVDGRIVVNILNDGTIVDVGGSVLSLDQLTTTMAQAKSSNSNTRLHLRADQGVPYRYIKEVSRASARGGVSSVIFSTYQTSK